MKYNAIPSDLFKLNRERYCNVIKSESVAVFHSNDQMPKSGDAHFPFKQNGCFFYLTGIDQEESILLLYPDNETETMREILFIKKTNEHIAVWEGHKYTKEEARAASGIETIYWTEDYQSVVNRLLRSVKRIYLNSNENGGFTSPVFDRNTRLGKELMDAYPFHKYHRSQPIMKKLRMIKSQEEVNVISHACDITDKAFHQVLRTVKPGIMEYQVEAEIIHTFLTHQATGHAYDPIIASGANACVLHYVDNNQACKDGDLLLMDFGAEYGNYAADLSRTIPVNGRFTERQKAVYEAVLKVMKAATQMLVPGMIMEEYNKEVGSIMEAELIALGLLDAHEVKNQDPKRPLYKKYFMHGTSHHLGIDVHDLSDRNAIIQAGMVFTCEPGIYIPEENLGVRLENDIVVTDNGPVDLMGAIPIEVEHIEELMNAEVLS